MPAPVLPSLLRLAAELDLPQTLEELLQRVVDRAAAARQQGGNCVRLAPES